MGTKFPIALVSSGGLSLEISSFSTKAKRDAIPTDAAAYLSMTAPMLAVSYIYQLTLTGSWAFVLVHASAEMRSSWAQ